MADGPRLGQGDKLDRRGAVRAFRSQLPRFNPFYTGEPASDADVEPPKLSEADQLIANQRDRWVPPPLDPSVSLSVSTFHPDTSQTPSN
eukprot:19357-Prorocentrum_minimum.AAC.6